MSENIILFKTGDGQIKLDVKFEDETVWLTRAQMATLFERDVKTDSDYALFSKTQVNDVNVLKGKQK